MMTYLISAPRSGNSWIRSIMVDYMNDAQAAGSHYTKETGLLNKTHECHEPQENNRAILLVRHPYDVIHSCKIFWREYEHPGFPTGELSVAKQSHEIVKIYNFYTSIYIDNNLLLIRYEDMHDAPEDIMCDVLNFLNIDINMSKLEEAITKNKIKNYYKNNSFPDIVDSGNHQQKQIMFRKGVVGEGGKMLDAVEKDLIYNITKPIFENFSYKR